MSSLNKRRYEQKNTHTEEPNYIRKRYSFSTDVEERLFERLSFIYNETTANSYLSELERIMQVYYGFKTDGMIEADKEFDFHDRFTQEDVILITYGDIIEEKGVSPLTTLAKFFGKYLDGVINTLHILPFFPYSSDRGFSVIDFEEVDPKLGDWNDIKDLEKRYHMMFDGVFNHVSSKSKWFLEFLNQNPEYIDYFVSYDSKDELSDADRKMIFRPRTSDILSEYDTLYGKKYVWTTFSPDQIDLNYKNPKVLLKMIEILLLYVRKGADIIRLDAVTYIWREHGTSCASLKEAHEIVKLFRDVLKAVAPHVAIITETNVPHKDNISYFGNGYDEANMVYNFALPPLVLHTFYEEDSSILTKWASELEYVGNTSYFNFLDSHDGIGLMAARGILNDEQINRMVDKAVNEHGAYVSTKARREGGEAPYEINSTWFSAINKEHSDKSIEKQVRKFIASRSIALALKGVPGIYFHSLLGTKNDMSCVTKTNSKRDINRQLVDYNSLVEEFEKEGSLIGELNKTQMNLIKIRKQHSGFHPMGEHRVLDLDSKLFAIYRESPDKTEGIICLTNIANEKVSLEFNVSNFSFQDTNIIDLISNKKYEIIDGKISLNLQPYDIVWLKIRQ
ncbi:MAG: alpha-amylase family glycosyl hydrolase [Campylobacterales bacterium]|nr:alpha-amylase family glycosyl hydrolase [Campylobacterales bacterium]